MIRQGEILNDTYQILDELGAGGGGIIYRARHLRLNIDVVVKQVKDEAKGVQSVISEADILKRLHHTYLPRVYDFLEIDGEIYTVMDFIDGMDLRKAVQTNGYYPQDIVLHWAKQLAEALNYLHSSNPPIIHGDIKPANIMLQPDGSICLIDFNVSLVFDETKRKLTSISEGFSPPEQYRNKMMYDKMTGNTQSRVNTGNHTQNVFTDNNGRSYTDVSTIDEETSQILERTVGQGIDERSDIYSLGATLYYVLTGVKPSSHYWENPPISAYEIKLSEGFSHIISKMMALDPMERYQNGMELKAAFDNIYELDSVYRDYRHRNNVRTMVASLLFIGGVGLCVAGGITMKRETDIEYVEQLLVADEEISGGNYDDAEMIIKEAMRKRPKRVEAYVSEIKRLYLTEDYDGVIDYGMAAINGPRFDVKTEEDQRSSGDIVFIMGNAYYEKEEYSDAVSCFKSAIERNDENGDYFRDYAAALAKEGNLEEALKCLEMAKKLGLGKDSIYMIEAEVSYIKKDYSKAIEDFRNSLDYTKDAIIRRRSVSFISDCYNRLGDFTSQIQFLEQYVNQPDSSRSSLLYLAGAYFQSGQYDKAAEIFKKSISLGDTQFETRINLASCYEQMGQLDAAANTLLEAVKDFPDRYEIYRNLSFIESQKQMQFANEQRNYNTMLGYYEKASELYRKSGEQDQQMLQLDNMIQQARDGGWFN